MWKLYEPAYAKVLGEYPGLRNDIIPDNPGNKFNYKACHLHSDDFLKWYFGEESGYQV